MPLKNEDKGPAGVAGTFTKAAIAIDNFTTQERLPIFWGPGQLTEDYPNYSPPNPEKWRAKEPLNIPQVVRFIHASDDDYGDEYKNDGDVDPPPTPHVCTYSYVITAYYTVSVKSAFRTTGNEVDVIYDPGGLVQPIAGSQNWSGLASAIRTEVITVKNNMGATIFTGAWIDCPQLRKTPSRLIVWTQHCEGGGLPEGGVDTIIGTPLTTMGYTHLPEEDPRCWSPFVVYDSGLDEVRDAPENGYTPAEVPTQARNFMVCSEDPPD